MNGTCSRSSVLGSTVYAGGDFTSANGGVASRNRLAAFTANGTGTAIPSWNPNANGTVFALDAVEQHDLPRRRLHARSARLPSGAARRRSTTNGALHDLEPGREQHRLRARPRRLDGVRGRRVHDGEQQRARARPPRRSTRDGRRHARGTRARLDSAQARRRRLRARAHGLDDVPRRLLQHGRRLRRELLLHAGLAAISLADGDALTTWQPGAERHRQRDRDRAAGRRGGRRVHARSATRRPARRPPAVEPDATYRGGLAFAARRFPTRRPSRRRPATPRPPSPCSCPPFLGGGSLVATR